MANTAFYSTVAQIIPVLLLVLVVEIRLLDIRGLRFERLVQLSIVVLIVLAEWRALRVLETGKVSRLDPYLAWVAISSQGAALIAYYLGYADARAQSRRRHRRIRSTNLD